MESQTNSEIVKKLLESKNSMEKSFDFASNSMLRAHKMNPVKNIRTLQLYQVLEELNDTQGDARKQAAADLVKLLNVKTAPKKCGQCGAEVEVGTKFCENCGAQL
ncbi:MAG: zinc ribbon domain-containing protein [Dehalococcoidales bacterium]|nr:zinc ribbon domain-containing protein [Dehalococcoidales bacterium]